MDHDADYCIEICTPTRSNRGDSRPMLIYLAKETCRADQNNIDGWFSGKAKRFSYCWRNFAQSAYGMTLNFASRFTIRHNHH